MAASDDLGSYQFGFTDLAPFQIDMCPTITGIVENLLAGVSVGAIAARFHRTLANVIVEACLRIRESDDSNRVCLSGGTFQNLTLLGLTVEGLRPHGFEIFTHQRIPPNDGGLSLGQAMIANEVLLRGSTV